MKEVLLRFDYLRFNFYAAFLFITANTYSQSIQITDPNQVPLIGVEVYTDDFSFANVSDEKGMVHLDGSQPSFLNFNYLGFKRMKYSRGQLEEMGYRVILNHVEKILEEVIILGRNEVRQEDIPFQIKTITQEEISSTHAQTSADALQQHGGVFVQKSQMGGGSPIIRGFEANRVLLAVDGVRLNNAIYRNGHLQNAITVDNAMLSKMDIIFGPNSLMYGSDALGGVVHFQTREPKLSIGDTPVSETNYYVRYSSANQEKSAHLDFNWGGRKIGSITSISIADYGDLKSGNQRDDRFPDFGKRLVYQGIDGNGFDAQIQNDQPNVQVGTGYRQFDVLQKLKWKLNVFSDMIVNFQLSTSSDVPRYDNLAELRNGQLRWGEWHYGPQKRILSSLTYRYYRPEKLFDKAIFIGSAQKIDEDRIFREFNSTDRFIQEEDVNVYGLTADFSKYLDKSHHSELNYGLDIQHNNVSSAARGENIFTGQSVGGEFSRYASEENRLTSYGAYIYWKKKTKNEVFIWNAGARFSVADYFLRYGKNDPIDWPAEFTDGVDGENSAFTWSVGGVMNHPDGWHIRSMISTAFRSPNIDDLSKIRVNRDEITFPNLDLKPEKSFNVELTIARDLWQGLKISTIGFYTDLNNAIVRRPFTTPGGLNQWITAIDTLRVVANQNVQDAHIYGLSINLDWKIGKFVDFTTSFNYTRGRERVEGMANTPLAHIPPVYGRTSLVYTADKWNMRGDVRYNGMKDILAFGGSEDNPDLATPLGALGWYTINIYGQYDFLESFAISVGLENLLDKHYRAFSSGVSAPGRNFIISVKGKF